MPAPFDSVATMYDEQFTDTRLGRLLRQAVRDVAAQYLGPGMRVLEIGCGTGEDAIWLARGGAMVVATDASSAMIDLTREKARRFGIDGLVDAHHCRMEDLPDSGLEGPYDGVFSNFGALNCAPSFGSLTGWLAAQVRPGGAFVAVVLGPWCLWEMLWQLAHARPRTAMRRLRREGVEAHVGDLDLQVWYPSARALAGMLAPDFQVRFQAGLGVLLPTSDLQHLVDRWPRQFETIDRLERRIGRRAPFRSLGDHYILALERASSPE